MRQQMVIIALAALWLPVASCRYQPTPVRKWSVTRRPDNKAIVDRN